MKAKTKNPVLYWNAVTDSEGKIKYVHLFLEGDEEQVSPEKAHIAVSNAQYMDYPVICIN